MSKTVRYRTQHKTDSQWSRDERLNDLVDVVARDGVVERAVEIVQQLDDLYRTTAP